MAKGDYVLVKTEIGGQLVEDRVAVIQNGGRIEVQRTRDLVKVSLLNRAGDPTVVHEFALSAVRSVTQRLADL